ncbi:MAG: VOC family protein, partial [Candidatus Tectomicrobia bacterium]|nr:VOC family protein [Candidatus Tectomicrobia bacterium]
SRSGSPGMAFLSCRINHHDINLVFSEKEKPQEPTGHTFTAGGTGLHHLALLVANKEEFEAWYRHITACGIKVVHGPVVHSSIHPEGDRTPGENRSFYFPDPSGNVIEILCDMGQMTSDNQIDMKWHAERLRRDGYPEEADRVREERSLR